MAKDKGEGRSSGNVMEPGDGYLDNGRPNLSPSAGYVAAEPHQYDDESDARYEDRLALWNKRKMHAQQIEQMGGATREQRKEELEAEHEAEINALDLEFDNKEKKFSAFAPPTKSGKTK